MVDTNGQNQRERSWGGHWSRTYYRAAVHILAATVAVDVDVVRIAERANHKFHCQRW